MRLEDVLRRSVGKIMCTHCQTGQVYNTQKEPISFLNWECVAYDNWVEYTEPKKKKKVTLYRYTYVSTMKKICQTGWSEHLWDANHPYHIDRYTVVATETKEIEVDE